MKTIILAAGGTGGHIFPALALAEELDTRGIKSVLITDKRFVSYADNAKNLEVRTIMTGGNKISAIPAIVVGVYQALWHIINLKAKAVVGFGGYPSFPTMVAAIILFRPIIIHEQNAVLGMVNKYIAPLAKALALTFSETMWVTDKSKSRVVGTPVRSSINALYKKLYPETDHFNILVTGGSQGATILSEIVPQAIVKLPKDIKSMINVVQQCRALDIDMVREIYKNNDIKAEVSMFFNDMPERLRKAHLVIGRAGASTIAELAIAGKPAILIPYPNAKDDHQMKNAKVIENIKGGWIISQEQFTVESLKSTLKELLLHPEKLVTASLCIRTVARPEAAKELADYVIEVAG